MSIWTAGVGPPTTGKEIPKDGPSTTKMQGSSKWKGKDAEKSVMVSLKEIKVHG